MKSIIAAVAISLAAIIGGAGAAQANTSPNDATTIRVIPIQAQLRLKCQEFCKTQLRFRLVYTSPGDKSVSYSQWTHWTQLNVVPAPL